MVFNKLSKMIQGSFKRVSGKFQGYFSIGSKVFQRRLKGVLREIQWVSRVFERSSKK